MTSTGVIAFAVPIRAQNPTNPDPAQRRIGYLRLEDVYHTDWDGDGDTEDLTAALSFRGLIHRIYTAEGGSDLFGDIITEIGDIETVDATLGFGSDVTISAGRDLMNILIRDDRGTLSAWAGYRWPFVAQCDRHTRTPGGVVRPRM